MAMGKRFTYEFVEEYLESRGYILLSNEYKNSYTKIRVKCSIGHISHILFNNFRQGGRCLTCENIYRSEKMRHSISHVRKELLQNGYILLSNEYTNAHAKISVRCPQNHVTDISFGHFHTNEVRCSKCNVSKGEFEISRVLKSLNITFFREKRFHECRNKRPLPFDFYIPKDGKLLSRNVCIEMQGKQHYAIVDSWGGEDGLMQRKEHDKIKRKFCEKNGIQLIEIAYWEIDQTEEILTQELY